MPLSKKIKLSDLAKEMCFLKNVSDGAVWYTTGLSNFDFPIPLTEVGSSTFGQVEKGVTLLRWLKKHFEMLQKERPPSDEDPSPVAA